MHLPQIIDAIHEVRSDWIEPYLENNRPPHLRNVCLPSQQYLPVPDGLLGGPGGAGVALR